MKILINGQSYTTIVDALIDFRLVHDHNVEVAAGVANIWDKI